jgi:vanillate O-demethylase ferredoxin subunit
MNTAWFQARIASRHQEADGIFSFELVPAEGQTLPPFEAGAHIDLLIGDKIRQYSICNSPAEADRYVIAIQREADGKGGSREACDKFDGGMLVHARGPKNLFRLAEGGSSAMLLAGGIGITPLVAMAEQLYADGVPFELHVCARTAARAPFATRLAAAPWGDAVHWHFDDAPEGKRTALRDLIGAPDTGRHLYICGPGGFISGALAAADSHGWPSKTVHVERFSASPVTAGVDRPFFVEIRSTGQLIEVPADVAVAQALEDVGIEILRSCNEGYCGTCITGVLCGQPDHRDVVLTDDERARNDSFTPCCSRALSDVLVLDL